MFDALAEAAPAASRIEVGMENISDESYYQLLDLSVELCKGNEMLNAITGCQSVKVDAAKTQEVLEGWNAEST